MISIERTAETHKALTLFYQGKYDYFKMRGRLKAQPQNPNKYYKIIAEKLITHPSVEEFFAFNTAKLFLKSSNASHHVSEYIDRPSFIKFQFWSMRNLDNDLMSYAKSSHRMKELISCENRTPLIITDCIRGDLSIDILGVLLYRYKTLYEKYSKIDDPVIAAYNLFAYKHGEYLYTRNKIHHEVSDILKSLPKF